LDWLVSCLSEQGLLVKYIAVGSMGGVTAAKRGECDVAGSHLLDEATGEYNRPFLDDSLHLEPGYGRKLRQPRQCVRGVLCRARIGAQALARQSQLRRVQRGLRLVQRLQRRRIADEAVEEIAELGKPERARGGEREDRHAEDQGELGANRQIL